MAVACLRAATAAWTAHARPVGPFSMFRAMAKGPFAGVSRKSPTHYDISGNMRLVLDTDAVIAGLRSSVGASRSLLLAVDAGAVVPLVSVGVAVE